MRRYSTPGMLPVIPPPSPSSVVFPLYLIKVRERFFLNSSFRVDLRSLFPPFFSPMLMERGFFFRSQCSAFHFAESKAIPRAQLGSPPLPKFSAQHPSRQCNRPPPPTPKAPIPPRPNQLRTRIPLGDHTPLLLKDSFPQSPSFVALQAPILAPSDFQVSFS